MLWGRQVDWALWVPALPRGAAVQPLEKHKPRCAGSADGWAPYAACRVGSQKTEGGPAAWSPRPGVRQASVRHLSLAVL